LLNSVENERVKKAKSPEKQEKQETNVGKLFVADNFPTNIGFMNRLDKKVHPQKNTNDIKIHIFIFPRSQKCIFLEIHCHCRGGDGNGLYRFSAKSATWWCRLFILFRRLLLNTQETKCVSAI